MWKDNPSMMTPQRLAEAYDYLSKSSLWWSKYRTWPGDVLPYYVHGFEGWDNSTIFDEGVPIVSPDLAAYLVVQSEVLSEIARALKKEPEAVEWQRKSDELLAALVKTLWKQDHFVGIIRPSGKTVECESLITCMPMILGRRLPDSVQKALVKQIREHVTPWGLASEKPTSSKYAKCSYWRGPVWAPTTMIVVTGLADIGETELVKTIARGFCSACLKSGFYENFDAKTGEGHYNSAYTWTSSVYMIFASQYCGN
jgi:glycogen debranching enzyme